MSYLLRIRQTIDASIAAGDLAGLIALVKASKAAGKYALSGFDKQFLAARSGDGDGSPLHAAARCGNVALVRYLLDQGCPHGLRDMAGMTPLMAAFGANAIAAAECLIEGGADLHATTKAGTRVFDLVLATGHALWIERLLAQGALLAHQNQAAQTSLHFACRSGDASLAFRVHEQTGISFGQPAADGRRPLDWSASAALWRAVLARYPALAPDIAFAEADCSLHDFARRGQLDLVCQLLDAGSDPGRRGAFGNSLMHHAVDSGSAALVGELLRRKVGVELRNKYNYRPLHLAASAGALDLVRLLVEHGAKVNVSGNLTYIIRQTMTPLYMAIKGGHTGVARYLVDHGAALDTLNDALNATAASAAAALGDQDLMRYLLEHGAAPNGVNRRACAPQTDYATFPLAQAANAHIVDLLVEYGADINAQACVARCAEGALRSLVNRLDKAELAWDHGQARLAAIAALLRHGASIYDGSGEVVAGAGCIDVARLLHAAAPLAR